MLLILALFFISLIVIPYFVYLANNKEKEFAVIYGTVCTVVTFAITAIVWGNSYNSYINMKKYSANFNIYAEAIASYEKLAVLDTKKVKTELTDLKYQNYQRGIKDLIEDLRNTCVYYNSIFAGKEVLGNNIIFSWLIIMPDDDMKMVKFSDFLDVKKGENHAM